MGRIPRTFLLYDGCYAHVISRSIAKQKIFENEKDFLFFENLLLKAKNEFQFSIFHYCLMHTHFHLIVSMGSVSAFSDGMKQVKWDYTRRYNQSRKRRGPLWQNRFKSLLIENGVYLYACGLYVEWNPIRAGIVENAEDWKFSSRRHYLQKTKSSLITNYSCEGVPDDVNFNDGLGFERGFAVGSDWFKYKLKRGM